MPLSVSQLTGQSERTVKLQFLGEEINITYRPGAYTPEFEELTIFDGLLRIVSAWDLLGDDGQPYPLTREALQVLPSPFLTAVWRRIAEDVRLDPTKPAASSAT